MWSGFGFGRQFAYWRSKTGLELFRFAFYVAVPIAASAIYANPERMNKLSTSPTPSCGTHRLSSSHRPLWFFLSRCSHVFEVRGIPSSDPLERHPHRRRGGEVPVNREAAKERLNRRLMTCVNDAPFTCELMKSAPTVFHLSLV